MKLTYLPFIMPVVTGLFVGFTWLLIGGTDGAYILTVATLPFSIMWMIIIEAIFPADAYSLINTSLTILLTITLLAESYVAARIILRLHQMLKK